MQQITHRRRETVICKGGIKLLQLTTSLEKMIMHVKTSVALNKLSYFKGKVQEKDRNQNSMRGRNGDGGCNDGKVIIYIVIVLVSDGTAIGRRWRLFKNLGHGMAVKAFVLTTTATEFHMESTRVLTLDIWYLKQPQNAS